MDFQSHLIEQAILEGESNVDIFLKDCFNQ
jgi:hypothetical protein